MLQKTQLNSFAPQNLGLSGLSSSRNATFTCPRQRQMYTKNDLSKNGKTLQQANLIALQPQNCIFLYQGFRFLDGSRNFVAVGDCHYKIVNYRSRPILITRDCEPDSEILKWNARKPGNIVYLDSLHRFVDKNTNKNMLHINTAILKSYASKVQKINVYIQDQGKNVFDFVTVQNMKKGVILQNGATTESNANQNIPVIEILVVPLHKNNKRRKPRGRDMDLDFSRSEILSSQNKEQFMDIDIIRGTFILKQEQIIIKLIKSEYGDNIILVTNKEAYQVNIEEKSVKIQAFGVLNKLSKLLNKKQYDNEEIKDVCFAKQSLNIFFLTTKGNFGLFEGDSIKYSHQIYTLVPKSSTHSEQITPKKMTSLTGKLFIESEQGVVYIFRVDQKDLYFEKRINLNIEEESISYQVNLMEKYDQLVVERVYKQNKNLVEILTKSFLSNQNQYVKVFSCPIISERNNQRSSVKLVKSKGNLIGCVMKDNTLTFYDFSENFAKQRDQIHELFSKTFFEKPINVSFDPYGCKIIVLFRQFVKFFTCHYNDMIHNYTYNVRNVSYAGYTASGEFLLIAVDDMLYFLNPFTFETSRVMQAYGDIKSIKMFDNVLYIILKNKVGKNLTDLLTLQMLIWNEEQGKYEQIYQTKIDPSQCFYTDHKHLLIVSPDKIQHFVREQEKYELNNEQEKRWKSSIGKVVLESTLNISLKEQEFPTCVKLCQKLGVVFIGTNFGRICSYLWPLDTSMTQFYEIQCSTSSIESIEFDISYQKAQLLCSTGQLLQTKVIQYISEQRMPNIYLIDQKTLYSGSQIKYQLAKQQPLYAKHSSFIHEDMTHSLQLIQQLKFSLQKNRDEFQQFTNKVISEYNAQVQKLEEEKEIEGGGVERELQGRQGEFQRGCGEVREEIQNVEKQFGIWVKKQKQSYENRLLTLYKQSNRLQHIYQQVYQQKQQQKTKFVDQNKKVLDQLKKQYQAIEQEYQSKFEEFKQGNKQFLDYQKEQLHKKIDEQLKEYSNFLRSQTQSELVFEQQKKQTILGANGNLVKQIANYKQRRDEFQALLMETRLQISELINDQQIYNTRRQQLKKELLQKEQIIQQKQRELISLVEGTDMMRKLKQSHQFELSQYETQFQPLLEKMNDIEGNIQRMNAQILKQYLSKVEKQKGINEALMTSKQLKRKKQAKAKSKLIAQTKLLRFLAELESLLQNPFDGDLKNTLNLLTLGENYKLTEEKVRQKIQNMKLMRKKQFVRKQIEEHEKREQHTMKNKTQILRHHNQNTTLLRQFNDLKKRKKILEQNISRLQLQISAAKMNGLETPRRKVNSALELKKLSVKKLTPFQQHEQQSLKSINKGLTSETRATRSGHSMSLLKSLIKDISNPNQGELGKMDIVRDRIRSFVNPQNRRNVITQRVLFSRDKIHTVRK